jgi:hypothetical protein
MKNDSKIRENRFWEKYAVLEKFNQKYDKKHVSPIDQRILFMNEALHMCRLHPTHKKAVAEELRIRIQRQKMLNQIARKKND